MKPVIKWELRQRRVYLLGWAVAMAALMLMLLSIYPSIHDHATKLNSVLNSLPAAIKNLKTGSSSVDVASPVGYLNSQVFYATLPLFYIIMSIGLGSSLLNRDESDHTIELILSRPLSRGRLLAAKAIAGASLVAIVALTSLIILLIVGPLVHLDISVGRLLLTDLLCFLFSLSFGAIAYTLTAVGTATHRLAVAVATLLSFGGYLMATLGALTHYLVTPAKFLPYHYYNPDQILQGNVSSGLIVYLVGCYLICSLVGLLGFRSRDIY